MLLLMLGLLGCTEKNLPTNGSQSPLLFEQAEVQNASTIAVLIPGALAPVHIFSPAEVWKEDGYALVYYRFPGLDGLPLDHKLAIDNAARQIAEFANQHPKKRIRLLGYSTGGPIAILASQYIGSQDIKVAAMSTAVPRAGGLGTAMRSTYDILGAAFRAGTFDWKGIWLEYYRTLLFGRKGLCDPDLTDLIDDFASKEKGRIIVPDQILSYAHTDDLSNWDLPNELNFSADNIRFYVGSEDPVFSIKQTQTFAQAIGSPTIKTYPKHGHLLFLTYPEVFNDIFSFFEHRP